MIFNVALALLKVQKHTHRYGLSCLSPNLFFSFLHPQTSKDDLIQTDFEGALKFFRVPVPKRYRSEENAKKLMELACSMKVILGAVVWLW